MISSNFTDDELKNLGAEELLTEFQQVMDGLLDGGSLEIRVTDTDYIAPEDKKPILPTGILIDQEAMTLKSGVDFYYTSSLLILLLVQLNPRNNIREDFYFFKICILYSAIISGTAGGNKNNNFIFSDIVFDKKYVQDNKRKFSKEEIRTVKEILKYQKTAYNFLAFSVMNFIRFNHHYVREKVELMKKGLLGLSENQIMDLLDAKNRYKNLDFFYENFVAAAKVIDDMKFYYAYIVKKVELMPKKEKSYNYYSVLGLTNVDFKDDIIRIRKVCTSNGFLILDITKAIIEDIISKKMAFLIPNPEQFKELLNIRNTIRNHPFLYHPSNLHFGFKDDELYEIKERFNTIMANVAGFIFCYSEKMYDSIREAKCRNKYMNKIKKDDEVRVKNIYEFSSAEIEINDEMKKKIAKDLNIIDTNLEEVKDFKAKNDEIALMFKDN